MRKVEISDMPEDFQADAQNLWEIFDRGVREAIAENEALGIVERDVTTEYPKAAQLPEAQIVSESD